MYTVTVAWLAVVAVTVAAVLFGQTARRSPQRRRRSRGARIGLFLSLSGPWLVLLAAVGIGALTGRWLIAASAGAVGVAAVAMAGLLLRPR